MLHRLYYTVKPYLPAPLRVALRRANARRVLPRVEGRWPILEQAGGRPEGWPGWPDGKEFAFVLTHDVEDQRGVDRCRALAELEMQLGFRSAFNFVPEGTYRVPSELLEWLAANGFEIGVHDLHHDGRLFRSRRDFAAKAKRINGHVRAWNASGFRAGFMLHELDWLHDLDIDYDASTFDVDPFEPQADGVETIFPFWVPKPDPDADSHDRRRRTGGTPEPTQGGFVELPYTLVQDLNLFIILRESTTAIWDRKLAWIANKGGMALLTTHPDFMRFGDGPLAETEYRAGVYAEWLQRVRKAYDGRMYHALPRDVARLVRESKPMQVRGTKEVGMLVYSAYERDNRVRRYAETLARRGDRVRVFSLASTPSEVGRGEIEGVEVNRLFCPGKDERSKLDYVVNYTLFAWKAWWALGTRRFPKGCDLVHVHNMPEGLVFAAARLRWAGAKIILDLHDLMPELYQDKFKLAEKDVVPVLLRWIEKLACRFSHHVIASNHLWKEVVARRSRSDGELTALINHVDLRVFARRARTRRDDRFLMVYPGSLNRHQGMDLAIEAMTEIRQAVPNAELHIYGDGPERDNLVAMAARLGLEKVVTLHRPVPLSGIAEILSNADLGIVPKRADGFGNEAFSTKIMEFMSQGLPVVLARTKIDSYYFNDDCVAFFEPGNSQDLAAKVIQLARDSTLRSRLAANAMDLVKATSWEAAEGIYLDLVDRLTRTRKPFLAGGRPVNGG